MCRCQGVVPYKVRMQQIENMCNTVSCEEVISHVQEQTVDPVDSGAPPARTRMPPDVVRFSARAGTPVTIDAPRMLTRSLLADSSVSLSSQASVEAEFLDLAWESSPSEDSSASPSMTPAPPTPEHPSCADIAPGEEYQCASEDAIAECLNKPATSDLFNLLPEEPPVDDDAPELDLLHQDASWLLENHDLGGSSMYAPPAPTHHQQQMWLMQKIERMEQLLSMNKNLHEQQQQQQPMGTLDVASPEQAAQLFKLLTAQVKREPDFVAAASAVALYSLVSGSC
jgi:hypothetical protein